MRWASLALPIFLGSISCSGPSPEDALVNAVHRVRDARTHSVEVIIVIGEGSCLACSGQLIRMIEERNGLPGLVVVNFASTAVLDVSGVISSPAYLDGDELGIEGAEFRTKSRVILVRNGLVERYLEVRSPDMEKITNDLSEMLLELEGSS